MRTLIATHTLRRNERLLGDGLSFFERLDRDVALYLTEVKAYKSGTVALRYEVRGSPK
ncbi:MAG: hypothetical protein ABI442_15125 [Gemmatimonadaceae bacterium]